LTRVPVLASLCTEKRAHVMLLQPRYHRRVLSLSLLALLSFLGGCTNSTMLAGPAVADALKAKDFTIYVDGSQKILTLPEVLSQYNPDTRQLHTGMLVQTAGPRSIEVEVLEKVAFDTYIAACRLSTNVNFDGSPLPQHTLQVKVDTATGTVEPMDDMARSYFEIEGSSFGD
jgi:hypothetical protein